MFFRLFALSFCALSGCVGLTEIAPTENKADRVYPKLLPIDRVVETPAIPVEPMVVQYLLQRNATLRRKRDALNARVARDSEDNS